MGCDVVGVAAEVNDFTADAAVEATDEAASLRAEPCADGAWHSCESGARAKHSRRGVHAGPAHGHALPH